MFGQNERPTKFSSPIATTRLSQDILLDKVNYCLRLFRREKFTYLSLKCRIPGSSFKASFETNAMEPYCRLIQSVYKFLRSKFEKEFVQI